MKNSQSAQTFDAYVTSKRSSTSNTLPTPTRTPRPSRVAPPPPTKTVTMQCNAASACRHYRVLSLQQRPPLPPPTSAGPCSCEWTIAKWTKVLRPALTRCRLDPLWTEILWCALPTRAVEPRASATRWRDATPSTARLRHYEEIVNFGIFKYRSRPSKRPPSSKRPPTTFARISFFNPYLLWLPSKRPPTTFAHPPAKRPGGAC